VEGCGGTPGGLWQGTASWRTEGAERRGESQPAVEALWVEEESGPHRSPHTPQAGMGLLAVDCEQLSSAVCPQVEPAEGEWCSPSLARLARAGLTSSLDTVLPPAWARQHQAHLDSHLDPLTPRHTACASSPRSPTPPLHLIPTRLRLAPPSGAQHARHHGHHTALDLRQATRTSTAPRSATLAPRLGPQVDPPRPRHQRRPQPRRHRDLAVGLRGQVGQPATGASLLSAVCPRSLSRAEHAVLRGGGAHSAIPSS